MVPKAYKSTEPQQTTRSSAKRASLVGQAGPRNIRASLSLPVKSRQLGSDGRRLFWQNRLVYNK